MEVVLWIGRYLICFCNLNVLETEGCSLSKRRFPPVKRRKERWKERVVLKLLSKTKSVSSAVGWASILAAKVLSVLG